VRRAFSSGSLPALLALGLLLFCPAASAAGPEGGLDGRGWELVSPAAKGGGEIEAPATGSAVFAAAAQGGGFAFGSEASFAAGEGAGPVSQYLAARGASGWATENLAPPQLSGTYAKGAYLAFSADLSRGLLTSGWRCRDGSSECAGENPPLGTGAPVGYRNLYLHEANTYTPLITTTNFGDLPPDPKDFTLTPQGASADLRHVAFATATGLYEWSDGAIELLSADPTAALAAPAGAISTDGERAYFSEAGNLHLRDGATTKQADADAGGGGTFQTASADGQIAYFTKAQHLYRYSASADQATDLIPAGEVLGVLGASEDGAYLYYLTATGLYLHHGATETKVAASADASNYPPATGSARVAADGQYLAFLSSASLTGYANVGKSEAFLYDAAAKALRCASCNPKGSTPAGPSSIPGASEPGEAPLPTYKPRALSEDGKRLFFDSADRLVNLDTDKAPDVYQWSAQGTSGCTQAAGCIGLISGGRVGSSAFLDASADGTDAYFSTATPLLLADAGAADSDVYVARAGGGFAEAPPQIPCNGDACQGPPPAPEDPQPGTALLEAPVNPPLRFAAQKPKHKGKHHGKHKGHHKGKGHKHHKGKGGRR
jgi:hypothetical protein